MSTLVPREPYSQDELRKLYPANLELSQVQIFLRHGERTPTTDRFAHLGLPRYWPLCNAARQLTSPILKADLDNLKPTDLAAWHNLKWSRRIEIQGQNDAQVTASSSVAPFTNSGICNSGELTDLGRRTTLALGQRLRHLYIDQLKFLPPRLDPDATIIPKIYMRSTHMPRALESLQQAFTGLYPPSQRSPSYIPQITTRRAQDDQLFPNNSNCARFNQLYNAFSALAAETYNSGPEMAFLNTKLRKHMPSQTPVAVDGHPALAGIMDTNNARLAHGLELPKEFSEQKVIETIEKITVREWFDGYARNREYRTVGIGGLVGDINENIMRHVDGQPEGFTFGMNGCHDTTLAGILSSFGAFEGVGGRWPPFTSHIAFEVFRDKNVAKHESSTALGLASWFQNLFSNNGASIGRTPTPELTAAQKARMEGYYVRGRFNDQPFVIPGCRAPGRHLEGDESFCTLAAFKEISDRFTPRNWKSACKANLGQGIRKEEDEMAGY